MNEPDHLDKAKRGEDTAGAYLAQFFDLLKPTIDRGEDLAGRLKEPSLSGVLFSFQVKTGLAFEAKNSTVHRWLNLSRDGPVVLIRVWLDDRGPPIAHLPFWDWLLSDRGSFDRLKSGASVTFPSRLFKDQTNFVTDMTREADRHLNSPSSPLRSHAVPSVPVSGIELVQYFGRLSRLEVPQAALESFRQYDQISGTSALHGILTRAGSASEVSPEVRNWIRSIETEATTSRYLRESRAFRMFTDALSNYSAGAAFSLPQFTWEDMAPWRVFVQVFPGAIKMLAAVLKRAPSTKGILVVPDNEQILSALLLTSTLANSDDPRISGQAIKLLREISTTFDHPHAASEDVYPFIRQYKFCRAEAEHGRHVNRCVDFLSRCERDYPGIDARRMRKYYRSANTGTIRAQLGKLTNPRSRDLHTQKITASIIELVEADSGRFSGP